MSGSTKRIIVTCLVIFIICLCLGTVAAGVAGWYAYQNAPQLLTGNRCAGIPNPNPALDTTGQMDLIESQVGVLRGLTASSPVDRGFLTNEELNQRVLTDFFKDFTDEDEITQVRVLAALGLLDKNFDLKKFYIDLYSEQIAGFYDQDTKEMVVINSGSFGGSQRMTYAHEYTHVLQDQTYDIQDGLNVNEDSCEKDSERCAAITALLEGDASLTESRWFSTHATKQDCEDVTNFYLTFQSPMFEAAPAYMQQDFIFPYVQGKDFVQSLYDAGGQAGVDAAYTNQPQTTEQILHPERYPNDKPVTVETPDLTGALGAGWIEIDRGVMGEWYTYLVLAFGLNPEAQIAGDEAQQAAEGWGGDQYVVYYNETEQKAALVLKTTWDDLSEANQFSQTFKTYAGLRFGPPTAEGQARWETGEGLTAFYQKAETTYWLMTASAAQLDAVLQEMELP